MPITTLPPVSSAPSVVNTQNSTVAVSVNAISPASVTPITLAATNRITTVYPATGTVPNSSFSATYSPMGRPLNRNVSRTPSLRSPPTNPDITGGTTIISIDANAAARPTVAAAASARSIPSRISDIHGIAPPMTTNVNITQSCRSRPRSLYSNPFMIPITVPFHSAAQQGPASRRRRSAGAPRHAR